VERNNVLGGVGRKIQTQLTLWSEMGHVAQLFALVPQHAGPGIYSHIRQLPGLRYPAFVLTRAGTAVGVRYFRPDTSTCDQAYTYSPCSGFSTSLRLSWSFNTNDLGESSAPRLHH
jgi:hypothetical protein